MAKKKLYGNRKDPRCETCANGKLTTDGTTVLCTRGGALPLSHSCRHYAYDPLRRIPKRRPLLKEYSAADFALDVIQDPIDPVEHVTEEPVEQQTAVSAERQTLDKVMEYLQSHEVPDTETLLAILKTGEPTSPDEADTLAASIVSDGHAVTSDESDKVDEIIQSTFTAPVPDNSPDILEDLEKLQQTDSNELKLILPGDTLDDLQDPFLTNDASLANDVIFFADDGTDEPMPLTPNELVFLSPAQLRDDAEER